MTTKPTYEELQKQVLELKKTELERKRIEEELQTSEAFLKEAQRVAHIGHWELDPDIGTPVWSDEIFRIFGLDPDEGEPSFTDHEKYVHSEDWPILDEAVRKAGKDGTPFDLVFRIMRPGGVMGWMHVIGTTSTDEEGNVTNLFGTAQDITCLKMAEEALTESEKKYRGVVENANEGIIVTQDGMLKFINRKALEILGYSEEELMSRPFIEIVHPDDQQVVMQYHLKRLKGKDIPGVYMLRFIAKDGAIKWHENSWVVTSWEGKPATLNLLTDITEHKRAEEAQRESEERYRVLVENAGEAIFVAQGGLLKFANKKTVELSGYTREELTSMSYTDFIHPDDRATVLDRHLKRRQGIEVPSNYSLRIVQRSGEVKWAELNVVQIDWQDEPATLNFLRDITERKQAEEGLRASQRQLRAFAGRLQKIREEERVMLSREIHDVMGGGLTGLKMDLSWLMHKLKNVESDKEQAPSMSRILASSESIDNMIQVVRRISTELRPPVLDDLGLIAALEWQLSEFTIRTGIPYELATAFEYVSMEADTAIGVFRIFQEAITNVVRHSQATKLTVVLREEEKSLSEEASYVLEIRDNGRGITEEEILSPGSLGLLGMQERVLAFGGELSLCGEPGGGTSVILKIPQDKKASPQA